jgi:hypothetical protein
VIPNRKIWLKGRGGRVEKRGRREKGGERGKEKTERG